MPSLRIAVVLVAGLLVTAAPAWAQSTAATVIGSVVDEQKAVLPGVTVTIQGSDRTQNMVTDRKSVV